MSPYCSTKKIEMLFFDFIQRQPLAPQENTMNSRRNSNRNSNQQRDDHPASVQFAETTYHSEDCQGYGEVSHHWKYSANSFAPAIGRTPELVTIDQYYELEEKHCPKKDARADFKHIETALPRHFAIVAATRQPRHFISRTESCVMTLQNTPTQNKIQSRARARIHTTCDITPFTEITLHQRVIIIARTGIAHLLVKKLAGIFWTERHMHQSVLTFADLIASCISSALACEYLVGNRYYRNLPAILAGESQVVGCPHGNYQITAVDVTPAKIQETTQELQELYAANIDRLETAIAQYARGFVSLESLRTDPDFVMMFSKFWRLSFQVLKARSCSESRLAVFRATKPESLSAAEEEKAERFVMCREIFRAQCQFSRLMQHNVAHLFDNSCFNYATLVRSSKSSQLRLCNDGVTAALLAFAAIEPRMVSAKMVPKLEVIYIGCDLTSAANHIQTRDPVFGEILVKHRQHVPLMKEIYEGRQIWRTSGRTSADMATSYIPLQSKLDLIRAGGDGERRMSRSRKPNRSCSSGGGK